MIERINPSGPEFECVDRTWGDQLWRYRQTDLPESLRHGLDDHLTICDACRLSRDAEAQLAAAIRAGHVSVAPSTQRRMARPLVRWASATALAASLALVFIVPPQGRTPGGIRRGEGDLRFLRPVEGEVLREASPNLSWTPIEGARSYRIEISEVGGDFAWSGASETPEIRLPDATSLPEHGIFRGLVQPVPGDLAGLTDITVAFARSGWREFLWYRAVASPFWLRVLAGAGLLGLMGSLLLPRRVGKTRAPA